MRLRKQQRERRPASGGGGSSPGEELNVLRSQGDELLSAADEAIRRALSGDSERFLRQARQQGGQ